MCVCRLCLKYVEGTGISDPSETIKKLQKFLPHMNRSLRNTPVICEICCDNVTTAENVLRTKSETEAKILKEIRRLKVAKINLRGFHNNVSNDVCVCRICLKLINTPRIFLCHNSTNILHHDYIKKMFKFCNINVDLNFSDTPVMCIKCWENLQIIYSFKKDYLEVERKIRVFCQDFKLNNKNISIEILQKICNYFSDEYCEIMSCHIKVEDDCYINMFPAIKKEPHIYKSSTPLKKIKKEEMRYVKTESGTSYSGTFIPPRVYKFNENDNLILVRVYYEVTKNEQNFPTGVTARYYNMTDKERERPIQYWKNIADRWSQLMPKRPIPVDKLGAQIMKIFSKNLLPTFELDRIKREVEIKQIRTHKTIQTQTVHQEIETTSEVNRVKRKVEIKQKGIQKTNETQTVHQETVQESDSDDSFVEEVVHSSFTPFIKSEPLNESDIEFNSIETKLEVESDCESLPQLERMDLPPLNFKIENIYSLEVKRETFDQFMRQDEETVPDDDMNKTRRSGRVGGKSGERKREIFKCGECNFETKYRGCLDRHIILHQRGKHKIYECPSCPYRISNKWSYNKHLKAHKEEEDEIPVLEPFMFPSY